VLALRAAAWLWALRAAAVALVVPQPALFQFRLATPVLALPDRFSVSQALPLEVLAVPWRSVSALATVAWAAAQHC
jgi:hypothetical protein